jgi:ubiquitin-like protein Pup
MATKKQVEKVPEKVEQTEEEERATHEAIGVDDFLDEIDSVLEENAEEFVRSYIQKGGELSTLKESMRKLLRSATGFATPRISYA